MKAHARILVADDEDALTDVISQVLSDDGYEVTTCATGEEALSTFQEQPFPLVITDIRMGGMTGLELLKKIKELDPETEVVIITSHASQETAIDALRAGAYDYLIKPFEDLDLISNVVKRAFEKRRLTLENERLLEKLTQNNEKLETANRTLAEMAVRDGLTGLHNHRYFQEALEKEVHRALRGNQVFSLLFLDVDHFKQYNDTHGHPMGDDLLCGVANVLRERVRSTDLVARYGGEEFVVMLLETDKRGAIQVAEDIRERVAAYPFAGREKMPGGRVTVSIGVATLKEDGIEGATLVNNADRALYEAKDGGRNCVRAAELSDA